MWWRQFLQLKVFWFSLKKQNIFLFFGVCVCACVGGNFCVNCLTINVHRNPKTQKKWRGYGKCKFRVLSEQKANTSSKVKIHITIKKKKLKIKFLKKTNNNCIFFPGPTIFLALKVICFEKIVFQNHPPPHRAYMGGGLLFQNFRSFFVRWSPKFFWRKF